ncbi:MAG: hypothetical protein WC359_12585 [Dehalococcoidia bacterium]|jgi:hypothetical protein
MSGYSREALGLAVDMGAVLERRRLELAAARVLDGKLAMQRKDFRRIGKTGRLKRQLSTVAVMNAVDGCGRDVMKDEEYWKDQDRREFGIQDGARTVKAMRNRLGKVTYRKVWGKNGTTEYGRRK